MSGRQTAELNQRRPETFVCCKIGVESQQFESNLKLNLDKHDVGSIYTDFIVTPIVSPSSLQYQKIDELRVVSDLKLQHQDWESKVAVSISYQPTLSIESQEIFRTLLQHALYLPTQAVIIDCPDCPQSQKAVASIVNETVKFGVARPLILFRINLMAHDYKKEEIRNLNLQRARAGSESSGTEPSDESSLESGCGNCSPINTNELTNPAKRTKKDETILGYEKPVFLDDWACWNFMRKHLKPDTRVGVCLTINNDIDFDLRPLQRWLGEPVRMITLSCDRFVSQIGCEGSTRLVGSLKEFIRSILLANSFMTALVVQEIPYIDMQMYLKYLSNLCALIDKQHFDSLRPWNDHLMLPLQPLSSNLDSGTYQIFELDSIKYEKYQEAMVEGIDHLMMRPESRNRSQFYLMVLGAGRGPLVDAMIRAIKSLNLEKKFKIYALDKNYSSVQAMKEKLVADWTSALEKINVEVVWADMRSWSPDKKADLIATELLGSFSDNELSPECIDGTWRFSTPSTISIPESYTSYIAPISSFKMHQELNAKAYLQQRPFDQIYVVRLTNFYKISEPQPLFTFEHKDLSKEPKKGTNLRQSHLKFSTAVDTVCHGFVGYFSAKLFGSTVISTVPEFKTSTMESWFPAYIPLEEPVEMAANTTLELFFFRKENDTHVWYEWHISQPITSRAHSTEGDESAMSKLV